MGSIPFSRKLGNEGGDEMEGGRREYKREVMKVIWKRRRKKKMKLKKKEGCMRIW